MSHTSMVGIAYVNNHNLDHPEIVDLLVTSFSSTLRGWWDSYLTEDSRESIKHVVKRMMKVSLFLMKILVEVSLMVSIPWSIPFSNILLVLLLIFRLEILIIWIIWDVLLCLITDGTKMFSFLEWCPRKIAISFIGKKSLLTVCLLSLLIR